MLARIETRLTDLGLNGKICRLGAMKNIRDMVANELKRGAKTIVAVGDDKTINEAINAMVGESFMGNSGATIPLGIIPVSNEGNKIAAALGVGPLEEACEILAGRRIEKLDLGAANGRFFISNASIPSKDTILEMSPASSRANRVESEANKNYSIEIMEEGIVKIINLPARDDAASLRAASNPQDGTLELFIQTKEKKKFLFKGPTKTSQSVFPFKKLTIFNAKNAPVILDRIIAISTPAEISIIKQKLNVVVGRRRRF